MHSTLSRRALLSAAALLAAPATGLAGPPADPGARTCDPN